MENKRDDLIIRIVAIAFLISVVIGFLLLFTTIEQKQMILDLANERFQWCHSFNQLKNVTDDMVLNFVNRSFEVNENINCTPLKPIIK